MSLFTLIVILGVLLIIGGVSLLATPLITFLSAGYFIIILFFIHGVFGIIQGISEKRYDKDFFFAVVSLVLGIIGFVVPGAAAMNNSILLYLAACWFILQGVLTIVEAVKNKAQGTGMTVLGVVLGVLEIIAGGYSFAHPTMLAVGMGTLIGFYFVLTGINTIMTGSARCIGGNGLTVMFTVMGVVTIIGGLAMLVTPLLNFLSLGHCIIILFFLNGVLGIFQAVTEKRYGKEFGFAILSLILGIIGCAVPGAAAMTNSVLLFLAAGWFLVHGVLSIIKALQKKKQGAKTAEWVIGIVLGVLALILGAYSLAHPALLAMSLGFLVSFYFIESGANMIFVGSEFSKAIALTRAQQFAAANAAGKH